MVFQPSVFSITAFVLCLLLGMQSVSAVAEPVRERVLRLGLLHGDPEPFSLPLDVLEGAFARLDPPARLVLVDLSHMNQQRALISMSNDQAPFDLFFSGYSKQRQENLLQVDVPLTMGLLGARVLVVNADRAATLNQQLAHRDDVQSIMIGSGIHWPDTDILEYNGYQILRGKYQGLWKMLRSRRIDAFARGIEEAFGEIEQRREVTPAPVILDRWLLVYPLDYFIYLDPDAQALHQELTTALQAMHRSGEFLAIVQRNRNASAALHWLRQGKHQTLFLENPQLSDRLRSLPGSYWLPEVQP